jgi:hypothetical protein
MPVQVTYSAKVGPVDRIYAGLSNAQIQGVGQLFLSEAQSKLQMCRIGSTDGRRIFCICTIDGFGTCSTNGEHRVASSRQVQCICARANIC